MSTVDLTGMRFGGLLVVGQADKRSGKRYWECKCDCGTIKSIMPQSLRNGDTVSCGCLRKEKARVHGMAKTSEYSAWSEAKARCYNPKNKCFQHYGERGIRVCSEWLHSFETFLKDMGPRPSRTHSLDRIDVNGNYCKENCRWADPETQQRNKRTSKNNTSGHRGVSWDKKPSKWRVRMVFDGRNHFLGYFNSLEEAVAARKKAEILHWKERA